MKIDEATNPYEKKNLDPALLTLPEWMKIVNAEGKHHPPSYDWSIEGKDFSSKRNKSEFPLFLFSKVINGLKIEFRANKNDRLKGRYVKWVNDDIVRDENGNAMYYTEDELRNGAIPQLLSRPYEYEVGAFDGDQYIGGVQDEWGAVLLSVADEYRGFGLGPIIGKAYRSLEPEKSSGGFTPAGAANFRKVHREMVRDYLKTGMYGHLVKSGIVTLDRVKEIIASAGLPDKTKPKPEKNLNFRDTKTWRLYHEYGTLILYSSGLRDVIEDNQYFAEKAIIGVIHVTDKNFVNSLYGVNEKVKSYMLALAGNDHEQLIVDVEDFPYVDGRFRVLNEKPNRDAGFLSHAIEYVGPRYPVQEMAALEKRWRKGFDRYDEFYHLLLELAHRMGL